MSNKKNRLIWAGVEAYTERGFYNTSVKEITEAAGVPKGSFAYYFKTKKEFTIDVIRAYSDYFCRKLDRILLDSSRSPLQRINVFIEDAASGMERYQFTRGCLVGNLGQEITSLDDACRAELLATLQRWRQRVAACLKAAQEQGELSPKLDAAAVARSFWYAWEGAVLGAKLERDRGPLEWVGNTFLERIRLAGDDGAADASSSNLDTPSS